MDRVSSPVTADISTQHPVALQLRTPQTMAEISVEKNSTIIFPAHSRRQCRIDRAPGKGFGVELACTGCRSGLSGERRRQTSELFATRDLDVRIVRNPGDRGWRIGMPNWLVPLLAFILLAGFIGFAFRLGLKVKPDKDNPDNWSSFGGPPDNDPGPGASGHN